MKVLFVTGNHPPEATGGTEQVVVALERELRREGVELFVLTGSDRAFDGASSVIEQHDGVVVERLFKKPEEHDRHGYVRPRLLRRIAGRLDAWRPDVVHVHSFAALGFGIGALCEERALPMVCTFHDQWITCARYFRLPTGGVTCPVDADHANCTTCVMDALETGDRTFVAEGLDERFRLARAEVAAAAACLAPSASSADTVRRCLPCERAIEVVPHGLLRAVPMDRRAVAPAPGERLRVGTFGGLVPEKGVAELVDACGGLDVELHLAGPFYDEAFAQALRGRAAALGLPLVVRGRYGPADRHPARDLHVAVFPSKCEETYGLVVDEALAHGVPVVCSDRGAFAERDGQGGVVVSPLARLADTLRGLVTSPARLEALRGAIPTSLATIADSARRHLAIYRRLR